MLPLIILTVVIVLSAVACHHIARRRGGRPVFWGSMGLVFGPFAIPFAFLARPAPGKHGPISDRANTN